jgi:putative membrane protein
MKNFKEYFLLFIKGMGMGAANVIPGVSGGTIALITGIFERLIDSIKSFDLTAVQLLFKFRLKEFFRHTDFFFLTAVLGGAVVSVFSLAKLLEFLFANYPIFVWSFFFGLILASVYFVGKTVEKWTLSVIITFLIGTGTAIAISVLSPATQNDSFLYLVVCGVVAICSMILPGLSGSFVLILLGNYELVMIQAVSNIDIKILLPVAIGAGGGLVLFSHLLSWVYKKFKNETISILTGFILGSLAILWPWKTEIYRLDEAGDFIMKKGEKVIQGYDRYIPDSMTAEVWLAMVWLIIGIALIWGMEKGLNKEQN